MRVRVEFDPSDCADFNTVEFSVPFDHEDGQACEAIYLLLAAMGKSVDMVFGECMLSHVTGDVLRREIAKLPERLLVCVREGLEATEPPESHVPWYGRDWRLLADGEVIEDGDEYACFDSPRRFIPHSIMIGEKFVSGVIQDTRRRVEPPSGGTAGYPCPNCGRGKLRPTGKAADGYPVDECDHCNTFSLNPVPGKEPPMRRILRALHDIGCEPGMNTELPK